MIRFRRLAFTFLVLMVHADVGKSCESLTVRDAAFQEPRDLHRVVLLTHEGDEGIDAIDARLRAWFATHEKEVNLEYVKVDVDQEGIDWSDYGIPGPPPSTPATLLVGTNQRTRKNFFVRHWLPAPLDSELDATIDSPFRAELRDRLLKEVGILVHVPATVEAREDLKPLLNDLESNWDEKEKCGVSLMTLDRNDPEEELLLSFLGVPKEGPDWVAILFGRGKAMDPWTGPEINEPELNGQLESLIGECSCLQTAGALGVDLPMRWTDGMDAMMVPLREPVEVEDPTVLAGMRNSGLTDGPVLSVLVIVGVILAGSVAILIVRSRRQTGPLATHWGR